MGFKELFEKSMDYGYKKIERTQSEVIKRVKQELRRKTDDEIRYIIRNNTNPTTVSLAEEADKRGISY